MPAGMGSDDESDTFLKKELEIQDGMKMRRKTVSSSGSAHVRAFRQQEKRQVPRFESGAAVMLRRPSSSTPTPGQLGGQGYVIGCLETAGSTKVHVVVDGVGSVIVDPQDLRVFSDEGADVVASDSEPLSVTEWEPVEVSSAMTGLAYILCGEGLRRQGLAGPEFKRQWNYLNTLLICVPLVFGSEFAEMSDVLTFFLSFAAIIPLAGLLGLFTEDLSVHVGSAMGALLNASFGNATEIIISIFAVKAGLFDVIKNSMLGSVMSNMLLVLGCAFLARSIPNGTDGRAKEIQRSVLWSFNAQSANVFASLLLLSTFCLVIPTAYAQLLSSSKTQLASVAELDLYEASRGTAIVMMISYAIFLTFQIRNAAIFNAVEGEGEEQEEEEEAKFSVMTDVLGLGLITVLIAFVSEFLVGSLESATERLNLSQAWVAVILIPIVGNAAEHVTAVGAAFNGKGGKGDMECAVGVAIGSSIQIAGFAVPLLVVMSWIINGTDPEPIMRNGEALPGALDMNFHPFSMTLMTLSVMIVNTIVIDGNGSWLEGVTLIACYSVVAVVYWFVPMANAS